LAVLATSSAAHAADAVDFATKVQPIFAARCIKCHGPDRQQAKLRLDSAENIGAFTKDTLLVAGKPDESELLKRISLPADDRKRMPKGGDPLTAEEIALVRQWIEEGAKFPVAAAVADAPAEGAAPAETQEPAEPAPRGEDDPELQSLPPASDEAIAKIQAAGGTVMPLFGESPLLQVSFAQAASPPGDDAIAALADAADQIVWLNLSKAQASGDGFAGLAKLRNLIQLHLEQSSASDDALAHLAELKRLEYLNVYGTTVTDAGVEPLKALPKLRNLYVWQTKVSYETAQALQAGTPGLEVNLGWDHPQVAKQRLAKELETAKKIAEETAASATALEQQLKTANESKDQAATRVKEIEDELKRLEASASDSSGGDAAEDKSESAEDKAESADAKEGAEEQPAEKPAEDAAEKDQAA
jgi:mono/diheme cytochrome c family protein